MIVIRTSGTEPKIKFYISVNNKLNSNESWSNQKNILEEKGKSKVLNILLIIKLSYFNFFKNK